MAANGARDIAQKAQMLGGTERRYNIGLLLHGPRLGQPSTHVFRRSMLAMAIAAAMPTAAWAEGAAPAPPVGSAIEEVIVFGHPLVRRAEDLAQPFVVLAGADLDSRTGATLGETVAQTPGVQNASFGSAVGRPVIRGLEGARVRTLEDNLDALDASTVSGDHAVTIEPFAATQIEILKGPSTLLYGSGAIGGVVNVITGRVPEQLPEAAIAGRVEVRGNDVADERTATLRLDGAVGQLAWHVDGLTRNTNDYDVPGNPRSKRQLQRDALTPDEPSDAAVSSEAASSERGSLRNSDSAADGYALGAAWHAEAGFIGASYSEFKAEYGLPGSDEGDVRIDMKQHRYNIVGGLQSPLTGIASITARVGINRYEHDELEPTGAVATHFTNKATDIRIVAEHEETSGLRGAVGIQVTRRAFSAIGDEAFVPPSDTDSYALFVTEATQFGETQLQFGGRYERVQIDSEVARGLDFNAFSLSAGVVVPVAEGHSISLQLDHSARAPVAEELLANGPHLATLSFEIGDPDLREEVASNISLSYAFTSPKFEAVTSVYYTAFNDFVFLAENGEAEDGLPVRVHLQDDAQFYGAEFESTLHLHEADASKFDIGVFGDYVRGRLDGSSASADNDNLPRVAPWRIGVAFRGQWNDVAGELSYTHVASQHDLATFELPTDSYNLLNLNLTWHVDLGIAGSHLEVFGRASNLLDEETRNHLSVIKDVAPMPGRTLLAGLRVKF